MRKHIIYLSTDANRTVIDVNYNQDCIQPYTDKQASFYPRSSNSSRLNRVVHIEEFTTVEAAQRRLIELRNFTRMQKEKLIRRKNPNWLNLTTGHSSMDIPAAMHISNLHMHAC